MVIVLGVASFGLIWVGILLYQGFVNLARFLSLSSPLRAPVMVIEGWISDQALVQASKLFWQEGYRAIITTGPPLLRGTFLSEYQTHAQLAAATLVALGIPAELIITMPCPLVTQGRTYTSALAVKQHLAQAYPEVKQLNLFTMNCHARRSWYIYRRLFQPDGIAVGVWASTAEGFDPDTWWQTSNGVRTVLSEGIAYLYVRFIGWDR